MAPQFIGEHKICSSELPHPTQPLIAAAHPDSAADEVIGDTGFFVDPSVDALTTTLARAVDGDRPPANPVERAQRYDWDRVAANALAAYQAAANGTW